MWTAFHIEKTNISCFRPSPHRRGQTISPVRTKILSIVEIYRSFFTMSISPDNILKAHAPPSRPLRCVPRAQRRDQPSLAFEPDPHRRDVAISPVWTEVLGIGKIAIECALIKATPAILLKYTPSSTIGLPNECIPRREIRPSLGCGTRSTSRCRCPGWRKSSWQK